MSRTSSFALPPCPDSAVFVTVEVVNPVALFILTFSLVFAPILVKLRVGSALEEG
jgi:hypothetical protein